MQAANPCRHSVAAAWPVDIRERFSRGVNMEALQ
jgi:hypothetical protein